MQRVFCVQGVRLPGADMLEDRYRVAGYAVSTTLSTMIGSLVWLFRVRGFEIARDAMRMLRGFLSRTLAKRVSASMPHMPGMLAGCTVMVFCCDAPGAQMWMSCCGVGTRRANARVRCIGSTCSGPWHSCLGAFATAVGERCK